MQHIYPIDILVAMLIFISLFSRLINLGMKSGLMPLTGTPISSEEYRRLVERGST